jgi:hypothetical protein
MKKYNVINTEQQNTEVHEYLINIDINLNGHEEITLYRSQNDVWSESARGQEVLKVIDTGDMLVFPKKMFAGDVGYDNFAELHIIMSFMSKESHLPTYKGRIEEVVIGKTYEI